MARHRIASARRRARRRTPPGAPPGTLSADPLATPTTLHVFAYGPERIEEHDDVSREQIERLLAGHPVTWVDVTGLSDLKTVQRLGEFFGLHGLTLEDIVNVHQRPKVEEYEGYLFIALRMPGSAEPIDTEQVSLLLGDNFVITFQERPGDCFEPVRARLRDYRGRIRERGADYLAYALVDAVTDAFFPHLEAHGESLERLEQEVMASPEAEQIAKIHRLKRDLLTMRRAIWPLRELLNALVRDDHPHIEESTRLFLRDCYDHTVQLMDMVDTNREIAGNLIDLHLTSVSNRMNEVMKVLTVIATIFIPLGFVAGLYGMNFDPSASPWNMPELDWRFGYPFALAIMAAIAVAMLAYFRRRGWIGGRRRAHRDSRGSG